MANVKIDEGLLRRIKEIIEKGENRFDFPNVKAFADKAILKELKKSEKKENG